MEVIADLLPAGVINIVNGFGKEAGQAITAMDKSRLHLD
jgi:acyl-CoA reductase-like NAD-dependent aldehyde dehydrogenase